MCEGSITVLRNSKVRNKLNNHLNVSIKDFSQPLVGYQANLLEEQDFEDGIEWLGYKKRLEYVSIEIINQGNSGNRGSKMYLKIDKASLSVRDSFNFDKMSIAQASLNFKIIDNTLQVFYY